MDKVIVLGSRRWLAGEGNRTNDICNNTIEATFNHKEDKRNEVISGVKEDNQKWNHIKSMVTSLPASTTPFGLKFFQVLYMGASNFKSSSCMAIKGVLLK
jgi:hypothetical protein